MTGSCKSMGYGSRWVANDPVMNFEIMTNQPLTRCARKRKQQLANNCEASRRVQGDLNPISLLACRKSSSVKWRWVLSNTPWTMVWTSGRLHLNACTHSWTPAWTASTSLSSYDTSRMVWMITTTSRCWPIWWQCVWLISVPMQCYNVSMDLQILTCRVDAHVAFVWHDN